MVEQVKKGEIEKRDDRQPYRVHLPGFIKEEEIGLGDVIKRTSSLAGIKLCGGCTRRAAAFNRWVVFTR